MILWNTEGLKPIGYLVWPLRSLKVRNPFLNLTWPGDLTFGDLGLTFWHKVCNSILSRYWKNGGAARRRFLAIREKPEGRPFFCPPSSARIKTWVERNYPRERPTSTLVFSWDSQVCRESVKEGSILSKIPTIMETSRNPTMKGEKVGLGGVSIS